MLRTASLNDQSLVIITIFGDVFLNIWNCLRIPEASANWLFVNNSVAIALYTKGTNSSDILETTIMRYKTHIYICTYVYVNMYVSSI